MTISYTSVFAGPQRVTRKKLCEILNLDTSRPGLKFTEKEIQRAYRRRASRFHPDVQSSQTPPIPTDICNILMGDIMRAKDRMLAGEDGNGNGDVLEKLFTTPPEDLIDVFISVLNGVRSGVLESSYLDISNDIVPWVSYFSNDFFIILYFSIFSKGQLNFHAVNVFLKTLDAIQPYLKGMDETSLIIFLHQLKKAFESTGQMDTAAIMAHLKANLPEDLIKNKKLDDLSTIIDHAGKELKEMLTDDFIKYVQHIVHFWFNVIATLPGWRHIVGVYFMSLLFTSSSLPNYFSAVKTVAGVIWEQKGTTALILSLVPMFVLTAVLLPLNIVIQLGAQFAWIAVNTSLQILADGIKLLRSAANTIRSLFNKDNSLSRNAFILFESILDLTIRLVFNIVIEMLDKMIFILSGQSTLSSFQSTFTRWFDSIISSLRPKAIEEKSFMLIPASSGKTGEPVGTEKSSQTFGFFNNGCSAAHEDTWLKQLLISFSAQNNEPLNEAAMYASG